MLSFKIKPAEPRSTDLHSGVVKRTSIYYISNTDKSVLEQIQFAQAAIHKPNAGEYVRLNHRWYKVGFISYNYTAEEDYMVQNVYCFLDYYSENASPSDPSSIF